MILITGLPFDRGYRRMSSAHSLGFSLGLLALHPDCQERVLQEVQSFVAKGNLPVCIHSKQWCFILFDHYLTDIRRCVSHEVYTGRHLRVPPPLPLGNLPCPPDSYRISLTFHR